MNTNQLSVKSRDKIAPCHWSDFLQIVLTKQIDIWYRWTAVQHGNEDRDLNMGPGAEGGSSVSACGGVRIVFLCWF